MGVETDHLGAVGDVVAAVGALVDALDDDPMEPATCSMRPPSRSARRSPDRCVTGTSPTRWGVAVWVDCDEDHLKAAADVFGEPTGRGSEVSERAQADVEQLV